LSLLTAGLMSTAMATAGPGRRLYPAGGRPICPQETPAACSLHAGSVCAL